MLATFLFALSACNYDRVKSTGAGGDPKLAPKLEPTLKSVQEVYVNARCVSCHLEPTTKNRNVALTDIRDVIEKPHVHGSGPHPKYLIKPGCPKQSFFLSIIKSGKMPPPPAERVSAEDFKELEAFVLSLDPKAAKLCDDEPPDLE